MIVIILGIILACFNGEFVNAATCTDYHPQCYAVHFGPAVCTVFRDWSKVNCARYCRMCPAGCKDIAPDCRQRGSWACTRDPAFMPFNCREFCGFCHHEAKTARPTTTTKPTTTTTTTAKPTTTRQIKLEPIQPILG